MMERVWTKGILLKTEWDTETVAGGKQALWPGTKRINSREEAGTLAQSSLQTPCD
jgi:hypothetical protein